MATACTAWSPISSERLTTWAATKVEGVSSSIFVGLAGVGQYTVTSPAGGPGRGVAEVAVRVIKGARGVDVADSWFDNS
jgi:hypothetical protein